MPLWLLHSQTKPDQNLRCSKDIPAFSPSIFSIPLITFSEIFQFILVNKVFCVNLYSFLQLHQQKLIASNRKEQLRVVKQSSSTDAQKLPRDLTPDRTHQQLCSHYQSYFIVKRDSINKENNN
jgi:hypothetical protein